MDYSLPGFSVHGDSPGKNTKVGCHAPLQGTFPSQGSNPGLPHCTLPGKLTGSQTAFYSLCHSVLTTIFLDSVLLLVGSGIAGMEIQDQIMIVCFSVVVKN